MAVAQGQRTTGNIAGGQLKIDMAKEILHPEMGPNMAPIFQITKSLEGGARNMPASSVKFSWMNDAPEQRFDAINNGAGYVAGATSIVVDTGTAFNSEDIVYVPRTGEVISVTSISTNTLTVERGIGASTAATLVDDDPLLIIGTADQEGDVSQAARSENPIQKDNYTQIFKTSVQESGSSLSSANESEPHDWMWQTKKQGQEHKKDIEYALLFGSPGTRTGADGLPRRTTGGLLAFSPNNRKDAGGTLSELEVEQWIQQLFRNGSGSKTVFVSALVLGVINQFAQGRLQTVVGSDTYGVKVTNWVSANGELKLVRHPLLEGATLSGYAIAVDFERGKVAWRYLNAPGSPGGSRDTHVNKDIAAPDYDGMKDEWLTEGGLQMGNPLTHGVLTNVTS